MNALAQSTSKVLAIIPARGGSKGVPHKNIIPLNGSPLISWSLKNALNSQYINRVAVSTDDAAIAATASDYGAEVIHRPKTISGDFASSELALIHVLDTLEEEHYLPDWIVFLQCTSPLLTTDDIDRAFEIVSSNEYDSIFSAYKHHFTGMWQQNEDGTMTPVNYNPLQRPMRQEIKQEYAENGAMYIFRPQCLRENGIRFGKKCGVYLMSLEKSLQIDTPADVELLEKIMHADQKPVPLPSLAAADIQLIVVDFDGTLTDDRVIVDENGREAVFCSRKDGLGIQRLKENGFEVLCLSSEKNPVVRKRCEKLKIECQQGVGLDDKGASLRELLKARNIPLAKTAFIGNGLNDISALKIVGLPVVVQDAHDEAQKYAKLILKTQGGQGALLEFAELLIKQGRVV